MKVNFTTHPAPCFFFAKGMLLVLVSLFLQLPAFSQSPSTIEQIGDLTGAKWKPNPELISLIGTEQDKMTQALSSAFLAPDEQALYKAYQRLLTYLENEIQAGKPINDALVTSYDHVIADSTTDPELKNIPEGHLITYVPGLVEVLREAPNPQASN